MTSGQIASVAVRHAGSLLDVVVRMAWQERWLYAMALVALATAFVVAPFTGNKPDVEIVLSFGWIIFNCLGLCITVAAVVALVRLGVVNKSVSPARDLYAQIHRYFTDNGRGSSAIHTLVVFTIFAAAFAVLKGAVAVLKPFAWDQAFAELDRMLHLGSYPHEWLMPLFGTDTALFVTNVFYNGWYVVLIASMLTAALVARDPVLRHQYVMSFMATWFVGGFLIATMFSSAGPCYFAPAGFGATYAELMTHLKSASETVWLPALNTQQVLWDGYSGERAGSAGISAFPSMHVASTTLIALAATRLDRRLGYAMWFFAAMIMLGSVTLGWHYAVDGYAGALIAWGFWKASGVYARRTVAAADA